jgi:hypothetical protein
MHFPRSVNTVILAEHTLDLSEQFGVPHDTFRRRALLGRPEGSRGDPHIRIVQDCADRLDSELLPLDNPLAAAKNAEAVVRISFARRNSRTSRSSSAIRATSSLVRPGAVPASTSARLTQVHNASGVHVQLARDPADRRHPLTLGRDRVQRHPGRPLTQLVAALLRCRHALHPL